MFMKLLKLSFAVAAAALMVGTGTIAHANQVNDGIYVFNATDGDTALDGSSVTFLGDTIVDWDLVDAIAASFDPYPPTTIPLTPGNSSIASFGVLGANAWFFEIDSLTLDTNYYDFFEGQNNLFGPGSGGGLGSLYDGFGDPEGNWNLVETAPVPDASGTFQLFVAALAALGSFQIFLARSREAAALHPNRRG
jgi:hypothetical protein